MAKKLVLTTKGWPCKLEECPPGFFLSDKELCFKSEYRDEHGNMEVYCESGEVFWGGVTTVEERDTILVQPVMAKWKIQ